MVEGNGAQDVGLAETIKLLRAELRQAQDAGHDNDVRFSVGSVEVELAIEVVKKAGGQASINVLNLLSIGGQAKQSTSSTNRVTIVLNPIGVNGEPFEVASSRTRRPDGRPGG